MSAHESPAMARPAWTGRLPLATFAVAILALVAAGALVAGRIARDRAVAEIEDRAAAVLPLASAALAEVIEKQRLIPLVLARDPEVMALLAAPEPAAEARLDAKLAAIAEDAGSAVLYLIDTEGVAVAASNAGQPDSFVGSDYGFRTYFTGAMAEGTAQQYALGTVSGRPGLYLSRRVDGAAGPLGVVVAKVEFDALEARWRQSGYIVTAVDSESVVVATSEPDWRFRTVAPVADEAAARAALQIGDRPLLPMPVTPERGGLVRVDRDSAGRDGAPTTWARATAPIGAAAPGWGMTVYAPVGTAPAAAARAAGLTVLLGGLLLAAAAAWWVRRRRWAAIRAATLTAMNADLEARVAAEIAERETAETRVRRMREELAQANRLSILGQISAGVAHEINQPVAAIRAYAESGTQLLAAGATGEAGENMAEIVKVTDRIGAITQMLRGFARRGAGGLRPVPVGEAVDGALALLAGRIRDAGARIVRDPVDAGLAVVAGRIRLEQILVNLLQNALDAVQDRAAPTIAIRIGVAPETVSITVEDNGPGLDAQAREQLFMPFATTKPTGLGLGLVISGDIAREFGGALRLDPSETGAAFTLELPRADAA